MQNKNKKQFEEKRLVYFAAELPTLGEGEIAEVKKQKEEEGPELDTAGLVGEANGVIDKYSGQLKELPPALNRVLHDEIVKYFLSSPGRFEKDEKKGLGAAEFASYRAAMVGKVEAMMKEYAPSQEDIKKMQEAKAEGKKAESAAEKLKPIDVKQITESPGEIADLTQFDAKFKEYTTWNASLQQEALGAMADGESVQKAYATYKKARDGVEAYKKFSAYIWPEDDAQRIALQDQIANAKKKLDDAVKKYEQAKDKIAKYGEAMGRVSNKLKQDKMRERDDLLAKMKKKGEKLTEEEQRKQKQFEALEKHQEMLGKEKDNLIGYGEQVSKSKDAAETEQKAAEMKKGQLTQCESGMRSAVFRINEALKSKELSPEARAQLEETKKILEEKLGEVTMGREAAGNIAAGRKEEIAKLSDAEKRTAEKSLRIQTHLQTQVGPTIGSLDSSIDSLEAEKMKFATNQEQVMKHYEQVFKDYDQMDEAVDGAILSNNVSNEKMIASLKAQQQAIGTLDVRPPSGIGGAFEATVGVIPSMLAGGVSAGGEWLVDQARWASEELDRAFTLPDNAPTWLKVAAGAAYIWPKLMVETYGFAIGTAGGLMEMVGGAITMIAHPVDTGIALGALIGRDPVTGKWSAGTAVNTVETILKAMISWEDLKAGRYGVGVGKTFANAVTSLVGIGGAVKGAQAAAATYKIAAAAGEGAGKALLKAAKAGAVVGVEVAGEEVATGLKGAGRIFEASYQGIKAAPAALKAAPTALRAARNAAGELGARGLAREAVRIGASGIEFVGESFSAAGKGVKEGVMSRVERLWGGAEYAETRLGKVARKETKLVAEISEGSPRYELWQEEMAKLRQEFPDLSDAEIKLKTAERHPLLAADAARHEANIQRLTDLDQDFEIAFKAEYGDKVKYMDVDREFVRRRLGLRMMADNGADFERFNALLKEKDPQAMQAAEEYSAARKAGKSPSEVIERYPQYEKALSYLYGQEEYAYSMSKIAGERNLVKIFDEVHATDLSTDASRVKFAEQMNKKYNGKLPEGPLTIETDPSGWKLVIDESGKIKFESALDTHFYSQFSDELPASLVAEGKSARNTAGWIDERGKIHYSAPYFEEQFGVRMVSRDGKNVFIVDGKELTPKQFFKTEKGKEVLEAMKKVKDHEVMHRIYEVVDGATLHDITKNIATAIEKNGCLKRAFRESGHEMNARGIQEFVAEIAGGKDFGLNKTEIAIVQYELEKVLAGGIKKFTGEMKKFTRGEETFTFARVRRMDTRLLAGSNPEDLVRATADALTSTDSEMITDLLRIGHSPDDIVALFSFDPAEVAKVHIAYKKSKKARVVAEYESVQADALQDFLQAATTRAEQQGVKMTAAERKVLIDDFNGIREDYLEAYRQGPKAVERFVSSPQYRPFARYLDQIDYAAYYAHVRSAEIQQFVTGNAEIITRTFKGKPTFEEIQAAVDELNKLRPEGFGKLGETKILLVLPDDMGSLVVGQNGHIRFRFTEKAAQEAGTELNRYLFMNDDKLATFAESLQRQFKLKYSSVDELAADLQKLDNRDITLLDVNKSTLSPDQITSIIKRNFRELDGGVRLYEGRVAGTGGIAQRTLGLYSVEGSTDLTRVTIKRARALHDDINPDVLSTLPEEQQIEMLKASEDTHSKRLETMAVEAERARLIQRLQQGQPPKLARVERPIYISDDMIVYVDQGGKSGKYFDYKKAVMKPDLVSEQDLWLGYADILDQLAECHEAGIVWRDFKPENISFGEEGAVLSDLGGLMTREQKLAETYLIVDSSGATYSLPIDEVTSTQLSDYLIEHGLEPENVQLYPIAGGVTPDYFSPEVALGATRGEIDFYRQDYYAAGVSMEELAFSGITEFEEVVDPVTGIRRYEEVLYPARGIKPQYEKEAQVLMSRLRTTNPADPNYRIQLRYVAKRMRHWYRNP